VGYKAFGKTHEYFPLVPKEKYTRFYLNNMVTGYFNGSFQNLVSFFAQDNVMKVQDIDQLVKELEKIKTKKP
jgi:BlaI family penicillinase repressor